jgi:hypothetical protein
MLVYKSEKNIASKRRVILLVNHVPSGTCEQDLEAMGIVALGPKRKLLAAIEALKRKSEGEIIETREPAPQVCLSLQLSFSVHFLLARPLRCS